MKPLKLFGIIMLIFLLGCSVDNQIAPLEDNDSIAHELVSLKTFNDARLLNLKIDWGNIKQEIINGVDLKEWPIGDDTKGADYSLLSVTENDSEKFFVLMFRADDDLNGFSYLDDRNDFSGTVNWFNTSGEIVALEAYKQGSRLNLTKAEELKGSGLTSNRGDCGPGTAWKSELNSSKSLKSGDCEYGGYYLIETWYTWTDWFYIRADGWEYAYRKDYTKHTSRRWVSTGRDYANVNSIIGGVNLRAGDRANNRIITDIATLERINAEENGVFLVPSCQSFEFADGPIVKAAGVKNIHTWFATGQYRSGVWEGHAVELNLPRLFFAFPKIWTNGNAANQSAFALEAAENLTELWYLENPNASNYELGLQWENNIKRQISFLGGAVTRNAPHNIPNLATYVEDFTWFRSDCKT